MKRRDLVKILQDAGWDITSGGKHDMAKHQQHSGVKIPIPRHTEINDYTENQILKEAGLK